MVTIKLTLALRRTRRVSMCDNFFISNFLFVFIFRGTFLSAFLILGQDSLTRVLWKIIWKMRQKQTLNMIRFVLIFYLSSKGFWNGLTSFWMQLEKNRRFFSKERIGLFKTSVFCRGKTLNVNKSIKTLLQNILLGYFVLIIITKVLLDGRDDFRTA